MGLFTDQKWVNLAPCFFDEVTVLRSPAFNVATWNVTNRKATGSLEQGILINGEPLGFYHFSGFDSGDQMTMLKRYGAHSPLLFTLREWYVAQCERYGQSVLGGVSTKYHHFSNGKPIGKAYRLLYRQRIDLQRAFPNPFQAHSTDCYAAWYDAHPAEHLPTGAVRIDPGVPVAAILADLARYFHSLVVAGRGASRLKRLLLKMSVRLLWFFARVSGYREKA